MHSTVESIEVIFFITIHGALITCTTMIQIYSSCLDSEVALNIKIGATFEHGYICFSCGIYYLYNIFMLNI